MERRITDLTEIIEGKKYQTEKSTYITTINNIGVGVDSCTDFKFFEGDIYKTPNGNYFIAGRGGAASLFGGAEDRIIPLHVEQAYYIGRKI